MPTMTTTSERVEKDRVKLRVEVAEDALRPALDAAYRRWANEIKVPGFRKGKVPRAIIDTRVGPEAIREEALREALPDLYRDALASESLEAIAPPEIEVVAFEAGAPIVFEATVDVRPEITLPDISQITIDPPSDEVTDADIDEQLERLAERFAELETVSREARMGDMVLIDLNGSMNGEPVEGASVPDYLYEVGSRSGPPKLDEELQGSPAGAILKFNDVLPSGSNAGQELSFTVLVKEVKAKKLPALDDEFAKTVGDFDSLEALREDLRVRLADIKKGIVAEQVSSMVLEVFVDASDLEPPERLVEAEFEHRLSHFEADLKQAGLTMAAYERHAELTELEIRRDMRAQAARSIKAELLLEEVARTQNIEVTDEDIGRELAVAAARAGRDIKEVAEQVVSSGRLSAIAADILRRKALDFVVQTVNPPTGGDDNEVESEREASEG